MPVLGGFELLKEFMRLQPGRPALVLTAHGSPAVEENLRLLGGVSYFEKPIDLEALQQRLDELLQPRAQGRIEGITLFGFLQLLEIERKTCTLTLRRGPSRATLSAFALASWSMPRPTGWPEMPRSSRSAIGRLLRSTFRIPAGRACARCTNPDRAAHGSSPRGGRAPCLRHAVRAPGDSRRGGGARSRGGGGTCCGGNGVARRDVRGNHG